VNNLKISLDHAQYKSKPKHEEIAEISKRLGAQIKNLRRSDLLQHLVCIGAKGQTFCPATFTNGKRKSENFEQMRLFVLDFDEGISLDEVRTRAESYELPILCIYETFSSAKENKFRVIFINETSITDIRVAQIIQNALMMIFPEADRNCKNVIQMYFGGKELLYLNEFILTTEEIPNINLEILIRNMTLYLKDKYGTKHYKRKVYEFAKTNNIRLNNKNLLDILVIENAENIGNNDNGKNLPNSSTIVVDFGRKFPNKNIIINLSHLSQSHKPTKRLSKNKKSNYHQSFRSYDLNKISSGCKLYQEFESGSRILDHNELFGIATNIIHIESGSSKFKNIIRSNSYFDDRPKKYSDWDYFLYYIKPDRNNSDDIKSYNPQSCDGFCPYKDQCSHGTNIISTWVLGYHQMERLDCLKESFVPIEEAENDFRQKFAGAIQTDKNKVYAIKAQTGIGKTQMYLEELAKYPSRRVLIAVPTNKLKHEVLQRAKALGIEMIESPSLRERKDELPDSVWEHIEYLYSSGRSIIPHLKRVIAEDNPECSALFKQHLKELENFYEFDGPVITTHKRLLSMDVSKFEFIIIDEDIIVNSIIPNKIDIALSELKKIKKKITPGSAISKKIQLILKNAKANELFTLPKVYYDSADENDMPMGVDISSLCSATHFCVHGKSDREENSQNSHISFYKPTNFLNNIKHTKIIMVSATVDKKVCEYYFGMDNVVFYECKKARYKGTLNQFYDKSMSRSCLVKDPAIIDQITKRSGSLHTICFKVYGLHDLYFGNTAGCDELKGKDINVIGTPHQPEWIYKLFAYSIGLDFDLSAKLKPGVAVERNRYRFRFMTYDDEVLRAIQFYLIESELEQSVGRARLLRETCTVNLFSNLPLMQAAMKKFEDGKEDITISR